MPPLAHPVLRSQLASGRTMPLYMLIGDDDVEKLAMALEFADSVEEGLRAFNVDRLHGGESKVDDLLQSAATFPMLAPRRIVLVFEAEKLLMPKREGKAADADQERLEAFVRNPPAHATVVFVCGPLDNRRRLSKLLAGQAQVVSCGVIEDRAAAARWVTSRAATLQIALDPDAVQALVDRAGVDVVRLRAGLERVALYAMGQPVVTAEDVRQAVTAGPEAQEEFGIAKAIQRSDAAGALRELGLALDSGAVPVLIMGQLRWAAERLPGTRLTHGIEALFRTDLALKSSGGDPRILLERLVVELCPAPLRR